MLPWKIQKLNLAPSLSYDSIHKPLKAPKGKRWNFDSLNKEWSLVDAVVSSSASSSSSILVDAVVITEDKIKNKDGTTNVTTKTINHDPLSPFVEHHIQYATDTFQGICLRYKITPLELRRANSGFTGENLHLVPNPLKIPRTDIMTTDAEAVPVSNHNQAVGILLKECRGMMSRSEAKAYLMLSDWDLTEALENAKEDGF